MHVKKQKLDACIVTVTQHQNDHIEVFDGKKKYLESVDTILRENQFHYQQIRKHLFKTIKKRKLTFKQTYTRIKGRFILECMLFVVEI